MNRSWFSLLKMVVLAFGMTACEYIHEDLEPCPMGLDLTFRYDYNLQRADMFSDHVGEVTVYLFDENGNYLMQQSESNTAADAPLRAKDYTMHFDLQPGRYQYLVLACQKDVNYGRADEGAKFRRNEPGENGMMEDLSVTLDHEVAGNTHIVPHDNLPLDTIWHGMQTTPVEVVLDKITRDTVSLVRNTKQIHVALREIDEPQSIDIAEYDLRIIDHNHRLLWDNSVDESKELTYTPYATWNTSDKEMKGLIGDPGVIAHADFMTSRLLYHDRADEDAILSITNKETGVEVVRVNLPDMLSRLRTSAEIYRYTPQEFLDRGYDYQLTFFLKGDTWEYVNVEISVLSWAKRIQYEHIGI